MEAHLLLKDGLIITMDRDRRVLKRGYVAIKDGRIAAVGAGEPPPNLVADRVRDCSYNIVLPGLVNAHDHLNQILYRGLADDMPPVLRFALLNRLVPFQTREHAYWAAHQSLVELMKCGVTTTTDAHWTNSHRDSMDGICEAVKESGMRALLSRVIYTHYAVPSLCQRWSDVQQEVESRKSRWDSERITVTVEGMIIRTDDETFRELHAWAKRHELTWTTHIQPEMTEYCFQNYRYGAIEHLARLGVLDDSLLAAHCNWLMPGELKLMANAGMRIAHSPVTQLWASEPVGQLLEWLSMGIKVGLGVDGALTNNSQNLWESMKFAIYAQRQKYMTPLALGTAELALELATIRAADALSMADQLGSIEVGKYGDFCLLDRNYPSINPLVSLLSNLVYSCEEEAVQTVIIGGQVVMENRKCLLVDEQEIVRQANRAVVETIDMAEAREGHQRANHWLFV